MISIDDNEICVVPRFSCQAHERLVDYVTPGCQGGQYPLQLDVHWSVQRTPTSNSNGNWHDKQYVITASAYTHLALLSGKHVIDRLRHSLNRRRGI
jgi:hypothetical protein